MKPRWILLSCFVFAFFIGVGSTFLFSEKANAMWCEMYVDPYFYQTDIDCVTQYGHSGHWLFRCEGWTRDPFGHWVQCACSYYRCVIPPKPPEEDPYQEP